MLSRIVTGCGGDASGSVVSSFKRVSRYNFRSSRKICPAASKNANALHRESQNRAATTIALPNTNRATDLDALELPVAFRMCEPHLKRHRGRVERFRCAHDGGVAEELRQQQRLHAPLLVCT